jgi:hypothetical protein
MAAPSVVGSELDDGLVLLDVETGLYFRLTGAGPIVWEKLSAPVTLAGLVAAVTSRFEVDPDTCRRDISALLDDLIARRLVSIKS